MEGIVYFRFVELRFPQATFTYEGLNRMLNSMKNGRISAGHICIPEEVLLQQHEYEELQNFVFNELPVRGTFRR